MPRPATSGSFKEGLDTRREGNGRKSMREFFTLDDWQWRNYKRYLKYSLFQDFKLMAHLARPKAPPRLLGKLGEFDDQVQFHAQQDGEGNPIAGGYSLDPLFEKRLDLCKFRLSKLFPAPPKEVEVSGEVSLEGLPPSVVNQMIQIKQTFLLVNNSNSSETPLSSPKPIAETKPIPPAPNGNLISAEAIASLTKTDA